MKYHSGTMFVETYYDFSKIVIILYYIKGENNYRCYYPAQKRFVSINALWLDKEYLPYTILFVPEKK